MKKKIIYFIAAAILSLTSCNLDFYPHNATSRDNVSESDLSLLYTGLYCYMQYKPTFNGYFQGDLAGGDFKRNKASGYFDPATWIIDVIIPIQGWSSTPWSGYYSALYQVNSFLMAAKSANQSESLTEMLGGAYFFRALIYYNLVSKYRNVPILLEPTNAKLTNSPESEGWALIESDLEKAIAMCPNFTNKNYVSKQAAKALMARVKIGQNKKSEAARYAEEVISESYFALADFEDMFRGVANNEEIFTFSNLPEENGINFCSHYYLPGGEYRPTDTIVGLFTTEDKRRDVSVMQDGEEYVINKFTSKSSSDPIIIIRLSEMYLISAEGNGLSGGGLARLNELRTFRGLKPISVNSENALLDAVIDERRLEFLAEGFRWFDLVRTGKLQETVGLSEKYNVFPIPQRELDLNDELVQNTLWQ